jgi:hypothetical protein
MQPQPALGAHRKPDAREGVGAKPLGPPQVERQRPRLAVKLEELRQRGRRQVDAGAAVLLGLGVGGEGEAQVKDCWAAGEHMACRGLGAGACKW